MISREGAKIMVQNSEGKVFSKWVGHAKLIDPVGNSQSDTLHKSLEMNEEDHVQLCPSSSAYNDRFMVMASDDRNLLVTSENGHELTVGSEDAIPLEEQAWSEIPPIPDDPIMFDRNAYPEEEMTSTCGEDERSVSTSMDVSTDPECVLESPEIMPRRSKRIKKVPLRLGGAHLYNLFG